MAAAAVPRAEVQEPLATQAKHRRVIVCETCGRLITPRVAPAEYREFVERERADHERAQRRAASPRRRRWLL